MELHDRERLARTMKKKGVTQRELAQVAGWKTHSYLGRLLRGDAKTLNTDPALRIAHYLGESVEDLFFTKVSVIDGHSNMESRTRKKVAA